MKQSKSGVAGKNRHHESRKMDDFLGDKFITEDGKHGWEGQDIEVHSDPLIEPDGAKKTLVLRSYYFKANPETMKRDKPTKQQLFNSHAKQLTIMAYADGLRPFEGMNPKVIVSKKRDEYKIFVAFEARPGVVFESEARPLQDITKPINA